VFRVLLIVEIVVERVVLVDFCGFLKRPCFVVVFLLLVYVDSLSKPPGTLIGVSVDLIIVIVDV
jgi:hypothetical protein